MCVYGSIRHVWLKSRVWQVEYLKHSDYINKYFTRWTLPDAVATVCLHTFKPYFYISFSLRLINVIRIIINQRACHIIFLQWHYTDVNLNFISKCLMVFRGIEASIQSSFISVKCMSLII